MPGKATGTGNTVVTKTGMHKAYKRTDIIKMCLGHRKRKRKEGDMVDKKVDDIVSLLKPKFSL